MDRTALLDRTAQPNQTAQLDRTERNRLIVENLPLVGYLVSDVWSKATHLSRDDLAAAGALALVTSADAFDPTLGVPFGAFARRRIIGAFADEMRSSDWATRTARKRIKETLAVQETLTAALGRTPSLDEVATALGVDRATAAEGIADASRVVTSLDDVVSDTLAAETVLPEDLLLQGERTRYLGAAVEALPERMQKIVRAVYFEDRTVGEIAEELGITHSAVSQQRSEAIRLLRDGLAAHYADTEAVADPVSRVSASARSAYLARVAERAMVGMARPLKSSTATVAG